MILGIEKIKLNPNLELEISGSNKNIITFIVPILHKVRRYNSD
jgi:hypothetical protein